MKVALITTLPGLSENDRIKEEVEKLGHEFKLIDLAEFEFVLDEKGLAIEGFNPELFDSIIVRGIFAAVKPISVIVESLRNKGIKVFDNNFIEHKYSIDKVTDLIKLSIAGISIPKSSYSRDFDHYTKIANEIGYPLIVKSTRAGKGAWVYKVGSDDELTSTIEEVEKEGKTAKGFLLQEFIDYEHDLRCLVIGDDVFTMKRIPAKGEFRANFSLGGAVEPFDLSESDKVLAIKSLKAVGMSIGGVDILIAKDKKRYILEVNHTAGFVGMEEATGKNIGKVFVKHALQNTK